VSAATQTMSAGPATIADVGPRLADPPRLADGTELLGEFRDSGDSQPPSLVRRPDGQVIRARPVLDGTKPVPRLVTQRGTVEACPHQDWMRMATSSATVILPAYPPHSRLS